LLQSSLYIHDHNKHHGEDRKSIHNRTKLIIQANLSLYSITALLILDSDGNRVLAKYYAPPHQTTPGTGLVADLGAGPGGPGMGGLSTLKEQKAFEKSVWEKVRRGGGELPIRPCLSLDA
jgi:hypothetical protein